MTTQSVFVKMAIDAWNTQNVRVRKLLDSLSDEQLQSETAPGRNRGVYLLGHLIAVSDNLFPLFGLGEKLYPDLENIFLKNPDGALPQPPVGTLRQYWNDVHSRLSEAIGDIKPDEWFARHNAVSEADFANEPHRNKLNVLINRASHTSYHLGQLVYLNRK